MFTVMTSQKSFSGACDFTIEAETTGFQGGDAGHGGYLKVSFYPGEGYASQIEITNSDTPKEVSLFDGAENRVSFVAQGDAEITQLYHGIKFLSETLGKQLLLKEK